MEIGIASPNEKEKAMQMKQYEASAGPLAPREKGVGEQMGDMYKQKAMNAAVDESSKMAMEGAKPYMQGMTNAINPMGSAGAGAVAGQATTNAALANAGMTGGAEIALAGQAMGGTGAGLATGAAGAGGMATLGAAVPYVGAAMIADQALGLGIMDSLFSEGGKVGPLSPQYKAEGGMSAEDYRYQMPGGDVYNARMERNKVKQAERESMPIMTMPDGSVNQQYYNMQEAKRQLQKQQDFVYPQIIPDNGKKMGALRMAYTDDPIAQKMYGVGNAPVDTSVMPMGFIGHPTDKQGYTARGYNQGGEVMSEEQAMALMNNQPEPMTEIAQEAMPMISSDPLMAMPQARPTPQALPTPRPSPEKMYLHNNPYDAAMIYEGYDPILDTVATPTPRPAEYKFGGGPLGMGVLGMYQDMMKKNMR
jgi:hypothetical protein